MKRNYSILKILISLTAIFVFSACKTWSEFKIAEPELNSESKKTTNSIENKKRLSPQMKKNSEVFVHKVRWKGETLIYISNWYTGSANNWKAIAAANPHIDPNRIFINDEIIIPSSLLKTRRPLPKVNMFVHKVRWSGETLINISNWYTGSVNNWKAIAEANPHIDPNRIFINDEIVIPSKLLKTRKPMPKDFVFVHKVRWSGEMLTYISNWYTGSASNWKAIAAANPNVDPNRIVINDEIIIPINLLKNRKPMPKNFIQPLPEKERESPAAPRQISSQDPEPASTPSPGSASDSTADSVSVPSSETEPERESDEVELFGPVGLE